MENEEQKFRAFIAVRDSGGTNMFDVHAVSVLSGGLLEKDDCLYIMKNFNQLSEKYGEEK